MNDTAENSKYVVSQSRQTRWPASKCILFRFTFCYFLLYYGPGLFGSVPGGAWLAGFYSRLMHLVDGFVFVRIIGIDQWETFLHPTGSGDTTVAYIEQCLTLIASFTATLAWSSLDRHRYSYIRLNAWLRVFARYALAFVLFSYAIVKVIPNQFVPLDASQLAMTYGSSSPMGLLWNFMGYSAPYTIFGGCAELVPAVLLLFRRTTLLGSLLASTVLLNVVMLNFCYDVPVKLYSTNLLVLSLFIVSPDAHKLFQFLVMNRPASPRDTGEPHIDNVPLKRTIMALKALVLGVFLSQTIYQNLERHKAFAYHSHPPTSRLTSREFHWIQE